ncbi:MAG TPA: sugar phosphate nucleotidyltransferase [Puia sp.]|nr:sugar phosphate nucleotidyltransferase [Puia sp.]
MIIKEAIILAGGLGTRLRDAVPELPKCMAPVGGRPFIRYVTDYFRKSGIGHFIFALGYKSDFFEEFFAEAFPPGADGALSSGDFGAGSSGADGGSGADSAVSYSISLEQEPLGTGGAIRQACTLAKTETALILNGDTFFRIDLAALSAFHAAKAADCSLCLKPMKDFDRFGVVELDERQRVVDFREKQHYASGLINGGVYALNTRRFLNEGLPEKFSFEKDYLEKGARSLYGIVQDNYFIDIGIPEDYRRVQEEINQLL